MEELFIKGGEFMWPLLVLLLVTLVVVVERFIYWIKIKIDLNRTHRSAFFKSGKPAFQADPSDDRAVLIAAIATKNKSLSQAEIENYIKSNFMKNNRFMRVLDVVTSTAPLLGILGTIWGIISSFNLAGSFTDIEPAKAMVGMAEAFITTAFGLIVSLTALFAHSYYQSISEKNLVEDDVFLTKVKVKLDSNE